MFWFLLLILAHAEAARPLSGYSEAVFERLTMEKSCDLSPAESTRVQKTVVDRMRRVVTIVDGDAAKDPPAEGVKRMTVIAHVIEFSRGSRAARSIGIGAGATKLRVRFTFKDAVTGDELFSCEKIGRYSGRFNGDGGSNEAGFSAAVEEVADGVAGDIEKNH